MSSGVINTEEEEILADGNEEDWDFDDDQAFFSRLRKSYAQKHVLQEQ